MIDMYVFFAFAFTTIYAVMMTIEVWSLRAKVRDMRYCKTCKCQIPIVCPRCTPPALKAEVMRTPYRTPDQPQSGDPPPLTKPGPGRSRLG